MYFLVLDAATQVLPENLGSRTWLFAGFPSRVVGGGRGCTGVAHLWLTLCNLTPSHHVDKFSLRYVATLNNDVRLDDLAIKSEGL